MEKSVINASLSTQNLTFRPGDTPVSFEVTVNNDSDEPSWLAGSAERRLPLDQGGLAKATFQCQPPSVVQAPSQNYPFIIEAVSNNGYPTSAESKIEALPVGFIDFTTTQKHLKILSKSAWLPDWKSDTASFELLFKNASNLNQQINVQVQRRDWRKCSFKKLPEIANLRLGETSKVILDVKTKRPWVRIGKTLLLEA